MKAWNSEHMCSTDVCRHTERGEHRQGHAISESTTAPLSYLGLLWESYQDDDQMVSDVRAGVQWNGHTARGALMQSTVGKRPQQQPGELANVRHALDELFGSEETQAECKSSGPDAGAVDTHTRDPVDFTLVA